jgi:hypothetical protein
MPNTFQFGDPKTSPDNYSNFSKSDLQADSSVQALSAIQPIPVPRVNPPVMGLDSVLGTAAVSRIQAGGRIAIHVLGDSGGIKTPEHQFAVADAMAADLEAGKGSAPGQQAFCYHLGDVVYYCGQEQ